MCKNLKKSLIGLFIGIPFIIFSLACATTKGVVTVPEQYSEIVDILGKKSEIYTKANLAFVDLFRNAESVIEFSDKEAGILKGKYYSNNINFGLSYYDVYSIIEVSVKDGKYRIQMSIAEVKTYDGWSKRYITVQPNDNIITAMQAQWKELATEFNSKMNTSNEW